MLFLNFNRRIMRLKNSLKFKINKSLLLLLTKGIKIWEISAEFYYFGEYKEIIPLKYYYTLKSLYFCILRNIFSLANFLALKINNFYIGYISLNFLSVSFKKVATVSLNTHLWYNKPSRISILF